MLSVCVKCVCDVRMYEVCVYVCEKCVVRNVCEVSVRLGVKLVCVCVCELCVC